MELTRLFDVEWRTEPDAPVVAPPDGRDGALIGSGSGVVTGPALEGTIHFSFYTGNYPYDRGFLADRGISSGRARPRRSG